MTYNVLEPDITRAQVSAIIQEFQTGVVGRVREGYTGREPGHQIWTFSSSLMFSLAIFTTIGQYQQVVKYLNLQSASGPSFQTVKLEIA